MGSLLAAEPLEVASLGLRLRQVSAAVADVGSVRGPSSWRGQAAEAFEARLAAVAGVLPQVEDAYAEASRVLLLYAAALEDAQLLARRASALLTEADQLSAVSAMPGPDPGDALRITAARWQAQAEELHDAAARRAETALRSLAAAAPRPRRAASRERFRSDAGASVWSQVSGAASLLLTAGEAVGGNRAARDELVAVAKQSWRVWEPFVEVYQQVADDRGGLAMGSAIGFLGRGIQPIRPSGKGTHGLVDDVDVAFSEALQEGRVRHLIDVLGVTRRPYRPGDSIGLFAHEAMNGHAVRQHVAKSLEYLRWRADNARVRSASSFPSAATAQVALDHLVRSRTREMRALLSMDVGDYSSLVVRCSTVIGHGYVKGDPLLRSTSEVYAGFQRVPGGVVLVSLYPKVR